MCAWKLVRAYNKVDNLEKLKRQHAIAMWKLPIRERTVFVVPKDKIAENAGYIVWKEIFFSFYTNDLTCTHSGPILDGASEGEIKSVGGLAALSRWTGSKVFTGKNLLCTFSYFCIQFIYEFR